MRRFTEMPQVLASEAEKAKIAALREVLLEARQKSEKLAGEGKLDLEIAPLIAALIREKAPFVEVLVAGGMVQIALSEHEGLYPLTPQTQAVEKTENVAHFA